MEKRNEEETEKGGMQIEESEGKWRGMGMMCVRGMGWDGMMIDGAFWRWRAGGSRWRVLRRTWRLTAQSRSLIPPTP